MLQDHRERHPGPGIVRESTSGSSWQTLQSLHRRVPPRQIYQCRDLIADVAEFIQDRRNDAVDLR